MHKDSTAYTILVIEDNTGDALLIREYLHEHIASPEILEAATYAAAIRFLESRGNSIDFILLDLTLPDLRGEELTQGILDASGDIPVMVLTGYNDLGFAVRSMEMGVSDYFLKDDLTAFSLYKSIYYNLERIKHYQEIERSRRRYNDLFHFSPQPMCVFDVHTLNILDANEAAVQEYGYSLEELRGMKLSELWHGTSQEEGQTFLSSMQENPRDHHSGVFKLRKKDDSVISVEAHSNRIDFEGSEQRIVMAVDITEQLAHVQAIEEQNSRLREIAWMQSHVVRAPLARLMGMVDLFNSEILKTEERDLFLDEIQKAAEELDKIIGEIVRKSEKVN